MNFVLPLLVFVAFLRVTLPGVDRNRANGSSPTLLLLFLLMAKFLRSLEGQSCWAAIYRCLQPFISLLSEPNWQETR